MIGSFNISLLPKEAFVAAVNQMKVGDVNLLSTDVVWSNPIPVVDNPDRALITLTAKPEAPFTGAATYTYDRIAVSGLSTVSKEPIVLHSIGADNDTATVHDILPQIAAYYGIAMTPSDWVNNGVVWDGEVDGCYNFTLAATPENVLFYGSVDLKLWPKKQLIPLLLTQYESNGWYSPNFV